MKKLFAVALCLCVLCAAIAGCGGGASLDPKSPVTLAMWHNFGGDMQQTMDMLIDEFNATEGKERGVIINVEAISSSAELQEALGRILNDDPGAPAMPDLVTAYPRTAVQFQTKGLLTDLDGYFTGEEIAGYVPAFVEEGRLPAGGLYVFPFAKSTELLFVNKTLFERFSAETGVTADCFATFEGIAEAAARYYEWANAEASGEPRDFKQFYTADSWLNLAQAGMLQQGASLFDGESIALGSAGYGHIWETCYEPTVTGGFAVYDGYSSDLSKTGDIICSTGSSAGVLFYGDSITYPDGTTEPVEYTVFPYPVFQGGNKIAIQRGNGFMVAKSDEARETAAAVFLKWFTAPRQNIRFVAETGYLPVTNEAFETLMPERLATVENPYIRKMLEAVMQMQAEYEFFVAPGFEAFDGISRAYEQEYKRTMTAARETYLAAGAVGPSDAEGRLSEFIKVMQP